MSDAYTLRRIKDQQNHLEAYLDRRQGVVSLTHDEQRQIDDLGKQHGQLFRDLEMSIPEPRPDDTPFRYSLRLLRNLQPFSPEFRNVGRLDVLVAGGSAVPGQIRRDAERLARNPTIGSIRNPGQLRRIERTDQANNTITEFRGSPLSWMSQFMTPVEACVVGFGDGSGRFYDMK